MAGQLNSERKCIVDIEQAKKLAKPYGRFDKDGNFDPTIEPQKDPFGPGKNEIPASLLSSEQIIKYVEKTGLVSPFYTGGGENSLLKDASYEGKIGTKAFIFKPDEVTPTQIFSKENKVLKVPANSIVFVECDLDFRLPDFIALRFNLQIKHVHRGLLLGTGPLIDPGYWGKLCIPLHNLTDEYYEIPRDEGLIWIEFTKTSGEISTFGRPPLGKEFWDIEGFIEKASGSLVYGDSKKVGIRSSIPSVVQKARSDSEKVQQDADKAADRAKNSEDIAKNLEISTAKKLNLYGLIGGIAVAIGLVSLLISLFLLTQTYNSAIDRKFAEIKPQISQLSSTFSAHIKQIDMATQSFPKSEEVLSDLTTNVQQNGQFIEELVKEFNDEKEAMRAVIEKLQTQNAELLERIYQIEATTSRMPGDQPEN